jgi:hypothetical protein
MHAMCLDRPGRTLVDADFALWQLRARRMVGAVLD